MNGKEVQEKVGMVSQFMTIGKKVPLVEKDA
jgi:hypothetical protein